MNEIVTIITDKLVKKVYTEDYNVFVSDKHELTANYAHEVRSKKLFVDLCKSADKPKMVEQAKMNYLLKYHQDCLRENVVPLPILFKVRNQKLVLKGYRLNEGLCRSLRHAFEIYPQILNSIKLQDNGISDQDLSYVLKGLNNLDSIK